MPRRVKNIRGLLTSRSVPYQSFFEHKYSHLGDQWYRMRVLNALTLVWPIAR